MGYIVNNDLILGSIDGVADKLECPTELKNQLLDNLRVINNKVVDAQKYKCFYIDQFGQKHIAKIEPDWQELHCKFDDYLINENDVWHVKTHTKPSAKQPQQEQPEHTEKIQNVPIENPAQPDQNTEPHKQAAIATDIEDKKTDTDTDKDTDNAAVDNALRKKTRKLISNIRAQLKQFELELQGELNHPAPAGHPSKGGEFLAEPEQI